MNPYWGKNLFEFLAMFFQRIPQLLCGEPLVSDEVQLFALIGISVAASLVGTFLVLQRMTMLANSLSHTLLLGIVITYIILGGDQLLSLHALILASLLTGLITALLTQLLTHLLKLQEDASIGLVFTTLFALGLLLITLYTRDAHIGIEAVMGNVDALHPHDLKLIGWVALVNAGAIALFFKEFKTAAFDAPFAQSARLFPQTFKYGLMVLTAATAIGAFRAVGVLLFLAFLVGPVITARLWTHRLGTLIFLSIGIGSLCSLFGVALSRHILTVYHSPLSTAGIVVALLGLSYFLSLSIRGNSVTIDRYGKESSRFRKHRIDR